ncbi:hypothetical protein AB0E69_10650 [Kribbella sp. NPDC026611]|uniref:S8 family serine peptidase n=1 Tax=Kribbella sp. NPDC026611 TaxID=3154911 RepID=UPI0033EC285B
MTDESGRLNRVIVKIAPHATAAAIASELVAAVDGSELVRVSPSGRVVLSLPTSSDAAEVAARLSERDDVTYAEADVVDRAQPDA